MDEKYIKNLPRWEIREPDHKKFEEFKKNFLRNKAAYYEVQPDIGKLMQYVGELESENEELKQVVDSIKDLSSLQYIELIKDLHKIKADKAMRKQLGQLDKKVVTLEKNYNDLMHKYSKLVSKELAGKQKTSASPDEKSLDESSGQNNP